MQNLIYEVKSRWKHVLNIGVKDGFAPLEINRIQTVNGVSFVCLVVLIAVFLVDAIYIGYFSAIIDLVAIFFVVFPTWKLNEKGQYLAARVFSYYGGMTLLTVVAVYNAMLQRPMFTEIVIIGYSSAAVLYFEGRLKKFSFLFGMLCYTSVFVVRAEKFEGDRSLHNFNVELFVMAFIAVYTVTSVYRNAYTATQRIVLLKNAELQEQKKEIELQARKLSELNKLKDKFLSIISHDLRSPLYSLTSLLELVAKEHLSVEEFKEIAGRVSQNANGTRDLLDNLLNWAQCELHNGEVEHYSLNMQSLILKTLQPLYQVSDQKGISIELECSADLVAYGNRDSISLVIRNLVQNAIKFSYSDSKINILVSESAGHISVTVADCGVGMSNEDARNVFSQHKRSTPGTNDERGTGLGLYMCKDFVEKNGGKIWVESKVQEGSAFTFTIPRAKPELKKDLQVLEKEKPAIL